MANLTIGSLAGASGVGVETVRFYQRRGLLAVPPRAGGIRRYDGSDVERLRFIKRAQAAGFTLAEIAELIALDAGEDRPRARELARARIAALDERIAELKVARASLAKLARECGEGRDGPCPIIASFG
jgi:MerR family transcriptional regulator, mercuric resistance operon regulatory protein